MGQFFYVNISYKNFNANYANIKIKYLVLSSKKISHKSEIGSLPHIVK